MRLIVSATFERGVNKLRRTCYLSDGAVRDKILYRSAQRRLKLAATARAR